MLNSQMKKNKKSHLNLNLFVVLTVLAFLQAGCGLVSTMGTPTSYEQKVPAEYKLSALKDRRILILVKQPYWLNSKMNVRLRLTDAIHKNLTNKAGVSSENLIAYNKLLDFRSSRTDFSMLDPAQVGKAIGANIVLFVSVNDSKLEKIADTNYYKGSLGVQTIVIDTEAGVKLWPDSEESRKIRVGFEVENKGFEAAVSRLANAAAHCIVRYFYDCKKVRFTIKDDKSDAAWEYWK